MNWSCPPLLTAPADLNFKPIRDPIEHLKMKMATAQEMKALDERAITESGIPSILLMEGAAVGIVDRLLRFYPCLSKLHIAFLCGKGNNGGDGLAVARHLLRRGADVEVVLLSQIENLRGDSKINWGILSKLSSKVHVVASASGASSLIPPMLERADLLIDAIFGTGLSHPVDADVAQAIEWINRSGKPVVSIDIPSGICADTGKVFGAAVRADRTLTLALPKRGHFLPPGLEYRGELSVVDIGIPPDLVSQASIQTELITPERIGSHLPSRPRNAHKGTYGHLLIIAGSRGKAGAATLASLGALRSGVGLVTLAHPRGVPPPQEPAEAMTMPLPETSEGSLAEAGEKMLLEVFQGKEAVALGPGLSQNPETRELLRRLIVSSPVPTVIDADGINALAGKPDLLKRGRAPRILTPHPGEMARLMGTSIQAVVEDRLGVASSFAVEYGVVIVLKGAGTVVAGPDGTLLVNPTGNPGMAKGGSGDVLTGMVGAHLAQGVPPLEAAALAVYVHGLSGDLAAEAIGEIGMSPSDLVDRIPSAYQLLRKREPPA